METSHDNTFERVRDVNGSEYYCETGAFGASASSADDLSDRCVETDVVRRYSGNIRLKE